MVNIASYNDKDFAVNESINFDLKKVYDVPGIEQLIFSYVNFDKCRKEIMRYEDKRNSNNMGTKHPKEHK